MSLRPSGYTFLYLKTLGSVFQKLCTLDANFYSPPGDYSNIIYEVQS